MPAGGRPRLTLCRWNAYIGQPLLIDELLYQTRGLEAPVQMTIGIADGRRAWAIRYSSKHQSRSLFVSEDVDSVRSLHPDNPGLQRMAEGDRVVVSEPLSDLPGAWTEIPESTALIVEDGSVQQRPFRPSPS